MSAIFATLIKKIGELPLRTTPEDTDMIPCDSEEGLTYRTTRGAIRAELALPSGHAETHQHGGSDEVATAVPAPNAIPKADGDGKLDDWVSSATVSTPGLVELATDGESSAGVVVQGNDARLGRIIPGVPQTLGNTYLDIQGATFASIPTPSAGHRRLYVDSSTGRVAVKTEEGTIGELENDPGSVQVALTLGGASTAQIIQPGTGIVTTDLGGLTTEIAAATATTAEPGVVVLAEEVIDTTAGHVVQASDARLSDARTPSGSAGGDLGSTYPNPQVVATHLSSPLPVSQGGTAAATLTSHGVLIGGGTSAVTATSTGTAGQILRSGGASANPAFSSTFTITDTTSALKLVEDASAGTYSSFTARKSRGGATINTFDTLFDLVVSAVTSSEKQFAVQRFVALSATGGSEAAQMQWFLISGGSLNRAFVVEPAGNLIVGPVASTGTSAASTLALGNGTAPGSSPADTVQLYSGDAVAGAANLFTRNEAGKIERLTGLKTRVSSQFDKTNTTLANVTGLSHDVLAGKTYAFIATCHYDANVTGGQKWAIGGTATATSIIYNIESISNATNLFVITSRQTALGGSAGQAGATAGRVKIEGTITVNAAGTLTVQFAQNAATGTSSVLVGSWFELIPIGD